MNNSELAAAVAEDVGGITKSKTKEVLDAAFETIVNTIKGGEEVRLANFATCTRELREGGTRRNPFSGENFEAEAKYYPKIKVSKGFKDTVATVKVKKSKKG